MQYTQLNSISNSSMEDKKLELVEEKFSYSFMVYLTIFL